jgi:superfamily II DNA or RNA helicase
MGNDLQVAILWSEPQRVTTKNGQRWVRWWLIPKDWLEGFFIFWNKNKDKLKPLGYTVAKNRFGEWVLNEWQMRKPDFREKFGKDNPPAITEENIVTESTLPEYKVKDVSGLRDWQAPSVARLCSAIQQHGSGIDGSDTGCHAKGQKILMFDGSIKNVEDIAVGDKLMGWDSTPREVLSLKRGRQEMAQMIPRKGTPWIVNLDHILTVNLAHLPPNHHTSGGYKVGVYDIKIRDWLNLCPTTRRWMKLFSVGVDCWEKTEQTIPPYLLGIFLGDGGMTLKSTVTLTSVDREIWKYLEELEKSNGWILGKSGEEITKRITNAPDLFSKLRDYHLLPIACGDKFIPDVYKICSREQRLQILAGLIDTDGWVESVSGYAFVSKSKRLRDDVSFIARSLGFFVVDKTRQCSCKYRGKKVTGTYHRCSIMGDVTEIPLKIQRKIAPLRRINKNPVLQGFSVKLLEEGDYYGFTITGDGRYLLGDFVVTHNTGKTFVACAVARELGLKISVVCPKSVISAWKKIITKHFHLDYGFVLNYESVKTGKFKEIGVWKPVSRISTREYFEWNLPKGTLLVFDESHRLKGWNTQNSEIALQAKKQRYKILCCSATNAINPIELKTTGYILDIYRKNFSQFLRDHNCEKGRFGWEFGGDKVVLKKLHADLFLQHGVRLRKEDIKGFPDCEIIAEAYNIDETSEKEIKAVYEEMSKELTMLNIKCRDAKEYQMNALVIQLRARQRAELLKVPLFVEMIEDSLEDGMSSAIFLNFSETIRALSKRLHTICIVWGENKGDEREKNIAAFQEDKERVILVNVKAGGSGLSLHDLNGTYPRIALISPTPSAVDLRQALGRIHRDGAKSKALQKIVFVANTEEEDTCERTKKKLEHLDLLNDGDLSIGTFFE